MSFCSRMFYYPLFIVCFPVTMETRRLVQTDTEEIGSRLGFPGDVLDLIEMSTTGHSSRPMGGILTKNSRAHWMYMYTVFLYSI